MVNEFKGREYDCATGPDGAHQCMYPSDLNDVGRMRGTDVLTTFNIETGLEGTLAGHHGRHHCGLQDSWVSGSAFLEEVSGGDIRGRHSLLPGGNDGR